jgi:hypothetical protein
MISLPVPRLKKDTAGRFLFLVVLPPGGVEHFKLEVRNTVADGIHPHRWGDRFASPHWMKLNINAVRPATDSNETGLTERHEAFLPGAKGGK